MCSIRERIQMLTAAAALVVAAGCSTMNSVTTSVSSAVAPVVHLEQKIPPTEPMNNAPIQVDGAMALRQWDATPAYYINDAVWSWPDYIPLQPGALPCILNVFTEPVLFLANLCYIPPGVVLEFPWQLEVYKSLSPPPSYTVMPPLPSGPEPIPTN